MDSSVSPKDEIWFLGVCHHISNAVYNNLNFRVGWNKQEVTFKYPDNWHDLSQVDTTHSVVRMTAGSYEYTYIYQSTHTLFLLTFSSRWDIRHRSITYRTG